LRQGNAAGAEQEYRAAMRIEPTNAAAALGLFNALAAQGRNEEALQVAQGIESRRGQIPNYGQVASEVGRLKARQYELIGQDDAAFRSFQDAIVADPSNP